MSRDLKMGKKDSPPDSRQDHLVTPVMNYQIIIHMKTATRLHCALWFCEILRPDAHTNGLRKGIVFPLVPVRVEGNKDINGVDDSRDIAKDCEQQADAELHLLKCKKGSLLVC